MKLSTSWLTLAFGSWAALSCVAGVPDTMMVRTEDIIRREYPSVSPATLSADRLVIDVAFHSTQTRLKQKGFSDNEIADIVLTAWLSKRTDPTVLLSETIIMGEVRKHGLLIVESTPSGASVTIDRANARNTQCEKWVLSGTHHIVIRKDGYEPAEGDESVPAEGRVTFKKELRPVSLTPSVTPH